MPMVPASPIVMVVKEKNDQYDSDQKDHQSHYFIEEI
jgi:hypothetical protein